MKRIVLYIIALMLCIVGFIILLNFSTIKGIIKYKEIISTINSVKGCQYVSYDSVPIGDSSELTTFTIDVSDNIEYSSCLSLFQKLNSTALMSDKNTVIQLIFQFHYDSKDGGLYDDLIYIRASNIYGFNDGDFSDSKLTTIYKCDYLCSIMYNTVHFGDMNIAELVLSADNNQFQNIILWHSERELEKEYLSMCVENEIVSELNNVRLVFLLDKCTDEQTEKIRSLFGGCRIASLGNDYSFNESALLAQLSPNDTNSIKEVKTIESK